MSVWLVKGCPLLPETDPSTFVSKFRGEALPKRLNTGA